MHHVAKQKLSKKLVSPYGNEFSALPWNPNHKEPRLFRDQCETLPTSSMVFLINGTVSVDFHGIYAHSLVKTTFFLAPSYTVSNGNLFGATSVCVGRKNS